MSTKTINAVTGAVSRAFCVSVIKRKLGSLKDHWTTIKATGHYSALSKVWSVLVYLSTAYRVYDMLAHAAHYISHFIC